MAEENNYKNKQQDLTELNSDGNRDRGRYGEDLEKPHEGSNGTDRKGPSGTTDEEILRKRIEELRKRDPFIYR